MTQTAPLNFVGSGQGHSGNVDALLDRLWLSPLQIKLFAVIAFALFCEGYDLQALALAVPNISDEFDIAPSSFSIALSASILGLGIGGVVFGPLGDRVGRKPMLGIAMLVTGISTLAALLYPTTNWIAICRVFTGIGLGITTVCGIALISDYCPTKWRFMIIAVLSCTVPLGAFVAAMIAPSVIESMGWRGIFWIGGIVPVFAALAVWFFVSESIRWLLTSKPDDSRITKIAAQIAPGIDTAKLHLAPVDKIERQSVFGLLSPACRVRTLVAWLSAMSGAFCLYLLISWLPVLLREAQWSIADALRGAAAVQLGGLFGSLLMAFAIDRGKMLPGMLTGYICASIALLAIGLLPSSVIGWQLLLLLVGAGTGGMQSIWMSIAVSLYPLELRATSAGWLAGVGRIGAISAPFVGGIALAAQVEAQNILLALVIPISISTIAIILARKHFVSPASVIESEGDESEEGDGAVESTVQGAST